MGVYKSDTLIEQSIYGSSRLGLVNYASKTGYRSLGGKKYELSNHLGNVLAVVSDNIHLDQDSTWTSLINTTDYYPFGLAMDGRSVQDSAYRYGFNGKEEDSGGEWGSKSHYDYGFRIYNPSIAKFLSVDPLAADYPWYTPYQFAGNNPIRFIDLDGLEEYDPFPDAYYRDAPKIPMTDGPRSNLNADGRPRSARYFWRRMMEDAPHMLSDDNKASIRAGRHVDIKVDDKWIEYNPTTQKFKGDQLVHHHIDQGSVAAAVPKTPHQKLTKLFHSRIGAGRPKGGDKIFGLLNVYGLYKDFFGSDPHDMNVLLRSGDKMNMLYFDNESNQYFNITDKTQDSQGRTRFTYDTYESYSFDKEDGRYVGVGYKETRIRVQDSEGKSINDYKEIKQ